jgi:hypothetical protein
LPRRPSLLLPEPVRELLDDAVGQDVGDGQDLGEDLIEGLEVGGPVLLQPGNNLLLGEGEVEGQEVDDVVLGPVGVRPAQEVGDLLDVLSPLRVLGLELLVVPGLSPPL